MFLKSQFLLFWHYIKTTFNFFFVKGGFTICESCYWRYKEILLVSNQSQ